ncbi:MAG: haloalkane dehalogenase, partial [Novosphingobium sp.]|nr:haloalkane dehalogenase [Novosphingobium sp.]
VALSNGGLPDGQDAPRAFAIWRAFAKYSPVFPIGGIVKRGTRRPLSAEEVAAYDAPFPTRPSKAAARAYPPLVPFKGNVAVPDQLRAWEVFRQWTKPFLCCFSDQDPITRGGDAVWLERVPGTRGMAHRTLHGGHFIQEDDPVGFAAAIISAARA